MLYFDCSSLPSTPTEELALWTHSFTHQSGTAKAQDLTVRLSFEDFHKARVKVRDHICRYLEDLSSVLEDFIRRAVRKLFEERLELIEQQKVFNVRFEETVYTAGTSQCMQFDAKFPPKESARHSPQQRSITEHGSLKRKVDTGPSGQNLTIFESGNKQKTNKKSKKTWGIGESVSLEDLKEQFGKKREEAAASLHVSISTFKRICCEHGISRWPSTRIKRDRLLLSSVSCNETDQVAANVQMPITRGPTAFVSTISVKSHLQKSWSSNLSINNENGTSFNENFLRKNEDNDRENIMIQVGDSANQELLYEPQEFEPACDSLVPSYLFPNAPAILSRLPQERYLPAKDATQFLSFTWPTEESDCKTNKDASSYVIQTLQKCCRTSIKSAKNTLLLEMPTHTPDHIFGESEQHKTDETSQLEKQYLGRERIKRNSEKEVILSVEDSSSYDFRSISEPIQGHLLHRLNEDQLISVDDMECTRIEAQSTVESKSEPSIQSDARRMKLIFEKLIMLPLEALSNPNHEASMKEALTILAGNLSLFTDEQAKQLLELKFDFPTATYSWRDCSWTRIDCQDFLAEFEKTKSLMETSTKEGEDLRDKYSELESKEKEMMAQLAAIQKEKNEITERSENFNQTKYLVALAEEQAGRTKEKELQITIATAKLNKLKNQWVSVQSSFI